jgi:hypothetical protein
MLHRAVALVSLFALSPAHATLIEHSFTSTITNLGGDVHEDSGVGVGDTIAGEFLFGASAPRTHYPHFWRLQTRGDDRQAKQANRYLVEWVDFCLGERLIGPLTNYGLQVPDASEWRYGTLNRCSASRSPTAPGPTRERRSPCRSRNALASRCRSVGGVGNTAAKARCGRLSGCSRECHAAD